MRHGNAVGLDYHQDGVQVCVMNPQGKELSNRSVANDWRAIVAAAQHHGPVKEAAVEACCGAADLAHELVQRAGWSVSLAHPGYVARMKQTPDKTDCSDSQVLADLTRVGYLPRVWLAPKAIQELRLLVRYRAGLVEEGRRIKQRVRALLREQRIRPSPPEGLGAGTKAPGAWTASWVAWLKEQAPLSEQGRWVIQRHGERLESLAREIQEVEKRLTQVIKDDPVVAKLRQEPGIGPVTAWVLRAEIGSFERFATGKQLARFCGVSPRNASSGARTADAGLIRASNPLLRATLIEAGHRLIRWQERWQKLAQRMKGRGKPAAVIVAAVTNRWIRGLYYRITAQARPEAACPVSHPT